MNTLIAFMAWLAVTALFVFGRLYKQGKYRERTTAVFFTICVCAASMWLLAHHSPTAQLTLAVMGAAVVLVALALATRARRAVPPYVCYALLIVAAMGLIYVLDKFTALPPAAAYGIPAAAFAAAYALVAHIYARRAKGGGKEL